MVSKILKYTLIQLMVWPLFFGNFFIAYAISPTDVSNLSIASESANSRIAPGEFLPISVKLINFGYEKRIDVIIDYKIFNNSDKESYWQKEVYSETETVAVETKASFVKRIQIPYTLPSGFYTLITVLHYPDQEQPAVSKLPFLIEKKIGGVFQSDLLIYSVLALIIALIVVVVFYLLNRNHRRNNITRFDYSDKPKNEIIYYEILNDVIYQMRLHIGDTAIKIAQDIPDLEINEKNGFIINIKKDPAKITALLIAHYEELIGKPISFDLNNKSATQVKK